MVALEDGFGGGGGEDGDGAGGFDLGDVAQVGGEHFGNAHVVEDAAAGPVGAGGFAVARGVGRGVAFAVGEEGGEDDDGFGGEEEEVFGFSEEAEGDGGVGDGEMVGCRRSGVWR